MSRWEEQYNNLQNNNPSEGFNMVTWNGSIPQPGNLISDSQDQLLTNNQTINTVFNDTNNGNFTKFLVQAMGTITPALVDPIAAYHTIAGTAGDFNGKPVPYFQNSDGDFPLMPDMKTSTFNYSFTIGKMIFNFGFSSLIGSAVTFATAFTGDPLSVLITGGSTLYTGGFVVSAITTTTMTITRTSGSGSTGYYYLAIGQ